MTNLRALFFGMLSPTSLAVLEALLSAGIDVCGVIIAVGRGDTQPIRRVAPVQSASLLPIANPFMERTIVQLAWERAIPMFEISRLGAPETLALLAELRPDVACVACFPQRIPATLLALPPHGFLNMHPALLPEHRGPEPLFWIFRSGVASAGATIHFMDAGFDSGDIALQAVFALPDGCSGAEVERRAAVIGGQLMVDALHMLDAGTLSRQPQPAGGSYEPAPSEDDWRISTGWTARRAFNFMRGTAEWGQPYRVSAGNVELALVAALAYDDGATLGQGGINAWTIKCGFSLRRVCCTRGFERGRAECRRARKVDSARM